jgi:hypothetical protein
LKSFLGSVLNLKSKPFPVEFRKSVFCFLIMGFVVFFGASSAWSQISFAAPTTVKFASCSTPTVYTGNATYYQPVNPPTGIFACTVPFAEAATVHGSFYDGNFCAITYGIYDSPVSGNVCGACVQAWYNGVTIVAPVVDRCACLPNYPYPADNHLDFSTQDFINLTGSTAAGEVAISWNFIEAPVSILQNLSNNNPNHTITYYFDDGEDSGIFFYDTLFPVSAVTANGTALTRGGTSNDGHWQAPAAWPTTGNMTFVLTDALGGTVTAIIPMVTGSDPCFSGYLQPSFCAVTNGTAIGNTGVQFPACNVTPPTSTFTSTPTMTFTKTFTSTYTNTFTFTKTNTLTNTYTITLTPTNTVTKTATLTFTNTTANTATPTLTSTNTAVLTNTNTLTKTPTYTFTNTPTPTFTNTVAFTNTSTLTKTPTLTFTNTLVNSATPTLTLTNTPSFTATNTGVPANTSTITHTVTLTFTSTPSFTATNTGVPPNTSTVTHTVTNTATVTSTDSSTMTNTATDTPGGNTPTITNTPTVTDTFTLTSTATNTFTSTFTATASNTPTITDTRTLTSTATYTFTSTFGSTATNTPTVTFTGTFTNTYTPSFTSTLTQTPTTTFSSTITSSPTMTLTSSATYTFTSSPTLTRTPTVTWTSTATFTRTPTNSPTATLIICPGIPVWSGNVVVYGVGQEVGYNGELYQCTQAHTSGPSLTPPSQPELWKDLGPCGTTPTQTNGPGKPVIYPNPVTSSSTTIQLGMSNTSNVKIQIFTTALREVQTIKVAQVTGDSLSVPLIDKGGHPLADGLYYFVIQINGNRWIDKVLVLR